MCEINDIDMGEQRTVFVPEQLRALAFVAEEDLESGRTFISGFLDLRASRAERGKDTNCIHDVLFNMISI